jgi:hypothetical protein
MPEACFILYSSTPSSVDCCYQHLIPSVVILNILPCCGLSYILICITLIYSWLHYCHRCGCLCLGKAAPAPWNTLFSCCWPPHDAMCWWRHFWLHHLWNFPIVPARIFLSLLISDTSPQEPSLGACLLSTCSTIPGTPSNGLAEIYDPCTATLTDLVWH